jgi:hypothetical protein
MYNRVYLLEYISEFYIIMLNVKNTMEMISTKKNTSS